MSKPLFRTSVKKAMNTVLPCIGSMVDFKAFYDHISPVLGDYAMCSDLITVLLVMVARMPSAIKHNRELLNLLREILDAAEDFHAANPGYKAQKDRFLQEYEVHYAIYGNIRISISEQ